MVTRICISKKGILDRRGRATGEWAPVVLVFHEDGSTTGGREVEIRKGGEVVARVVYDPNDPLPGGAEAWIETDAEVEVTR